MSGLPFIKFYTSDWRSEPTLKLVSREARSFWMDCICLIHEAGAGRLEVAGRPATDRDLSAILGDNPRTVRKLLSELEAAGVFSRDDDGFIISRRLVKDIEKAEQDRNNGRKGGNPLLKSGAYKKEGLTPRSQKPEARDQRPEKKEESPPPLIPPPAREAPASSGGGGDFQSDFEEIDALLGEVREASGVRVVDVAAGRATVRRWLGLGLGREEIIAQVRARTEKLMAKDPPDPPFALAAFDVSMDQLAAAKARGPKAPPEFKPEEIFERKVISASRILEATGSLPEWMKTPEIAAALIERDLATYDQLRRIVPAENLPRRKA